MAAGAGQRAMKPHTLPLDWRPTPGDIEYAKSKGLCEEQAMEEARSFYAHFTNGPGSGTKWKTWSGGLGAWGTWVRKTKPWTEHDPRRPKEQKMPGRIDAPTLPAEMTDKAQRLPKREFKPLTDLERASLLQEIYDAEPEKRREPLKPLHVPMPDEYWERFGVEPPKR